MAKIIVALSGGVDSAISAYLLKQTKHQVIGVFMRNWDSLVNHDIFGNPTLKLESCSQEKDWKDAKAIAKQLNIPIERVDFVDEYWNLVFKDFINQYKNGYTPNPDILCNKYIKFGVLMQWIEQKFPDYDFLATGHYASIKDGFLLKPKDKLKDQTYFLSQLKLNQLKKVIFPLENWTKKDVKTLAQKINLVVANKKESMGICFIGKRKFQDFLKNYILAKPGDVVDLSTNLVIAKHQGAMYYTIGQRHGLNLGGQKQPYYVAGYDLVKKIIYVAPQNDLSYLQSDQLTLKDCNWIIDPFTIKTPIYAKFRYRSLEIKVKVKMINGVVNVFYVEGFEAVTPGQHCVFYTENYCLGGGIIEDVFWKGKIKKYLLGNKKIIN